MSTWTNIEDNKPEPGIDIEYEDVDGRRGTTFLCTRCKNCWRCPITGGGVLIEVKRWRYKEDVPIK